MTYLHKLAKRLACLPCAVGTTLALASCGQGQVQEYLGPDPNSKTLVGLTIAPRDPQVAVGDSVRLEAIGWYSDGKSAAVQATWSATGGSISAHGWFRPSGVGDFRVRAAATAKPSLSDSVRVAAFSLLGGIARMQVLPAVGVMPKGTTQQFFALVTLTDGTIVQPTVSWSASGGTITASGLFTASGAEGPVIVTATLGTMATAQTQVVIQPPVLTQLVLNPGVVVMESGETRAVNVAASWSDGSTSLPPLSWSVEGGSLSPQGLFTAGAASGSYRIIVLSPAFAVADTALVTILPQIVAIELLPEQATLAPGASQPLQAFVLRNDGTRSTGSVQWSATGGTITLGGTYTAGATQGAYRVVGVLQTLGGQTFADTSSFNVVSGSATLSQLSVTPEVATVPAGDKHQFVASGTWSDGSAAVPAIDWSASAGVVDATGLFTAPQQVGSVRVVGKHRGGTRADTATVTITPKLRDFRISPKVDTIPTGYSRQFSATLSWSDGESHPVTIEWQTTGGAISSSGEYTPGALVGTFLVVAVCGCGATDTASVTVRSSEPPASPTLMSLVLTPQSIALALGSVQQFSVSGIWSDNTTGPVPAVYEATGGTISPGGLYTAGNAPGTFWVIARHQGGYRADTSFVTVGSPEGGKTLTGLTMTPDTQIVLPGASQLFSVLPQYSDGSTTPLPALSFSATGGTITPGGVYTAAGTAGSYQVIVRHQGGTKADTSNITIPTLTALTLAPDSVSVGWGGAQLFAASGSWTGGATGAPKVTFSATGGTISPTGLFTAGNTAGSYRVVAQYAYGAQADTAVVTVTSAAAPPPPVGSAGDLVVYPSPEVEFIIGPQLRSGAGSNPWPWFDSNMQTRGLTHGSVFPVSPGAEPNDHDYYLNRNYYDLGLALYQEYYRTGNATFLSYARKVADSWWLDAAQGGTNSNYDGSWSPRGASLGGLMLRALDGRPEMWPWIEGYIRHHYQTWLGARLNNSQLHYGVRDGGYMQLYAALLAMVSPNSSVRSEFRQKALDAAKLYYARLQDNDGGWYWPIDTDNNLGTPDIAASQPFQVGLLLEGLIATHRLTGDAVVAQSITHAVDWLWAKSYEQQAPSNLPSARWRAMRYFTIQANYLSNNRTSAYLYGVQDGAIRDARQLNATTIHAFGYAYKLTGDTKYLTWGDNVFSATFGKGQGPGADAYWGLADFREKEYNQSYRSAGRYLAWRAGF